MLCHQYILWYLLFGQANVPDFVERTYCSVVGGVKSILHMEHVDIARNPDTVDILTATGHQHQQRDLSEIERQHHFSLISPPVTELSLSRAYVGVGQPTGATVNSADESFRISGNGASLE